MNILLTGGRSPYTYDLAKKLRQPHTALFVADSIPVYLCQSSNLFTQHFKVASPRYALKKFTDDLIEIIRNHHINLLIPTCEEVFFIAAIKSKLPDYCEVFCDDLNTLKTLHDKHAFNMRLTSRAVRTPKTILLDHDTTDDLIENTFPAGHICKNQFSRFGNTFRLNPSIAQMRVLDKQSNRLLVQEYVIGSEICAYAIVKNGKVVASAAYKNLMTAGDGSGIMFESYQNKKIDVFFNEAVQQFNINNGQLAFDFIVTPQDEFYVLECNPRCTSGMHFLSANQVLASFESPNPTPREETRPITKQIILASLIFGPWNLLHKKIGFPKYLQRVFGSSDVSFNLSDIKPFFYQIYVVLFYIMKAVITRTSPIVLTTQDIEYNGQDL